MKDYYNLKKKKPRIRSLRIWYLLLLFFVLSFMGVQKSFAQLSISISSCNQGFVQPGSTDPAGNVLANGAYKIRYYVSLANASLATGYNAGDQINTIQVVNDLEHYFGDATILFIDRESCSTSQTSDGQGGYYPRDWDMTDIDTTEFNEADATPGADGIFLAASVANNILYPRQTIGISYCLYVSPDYVGDANVIARSYPDASGSGIVFDNTVSATSSNGNPTAHINITDFHTTDAFIVGAMNQSGHHNWEPPVNTDGTYTFTTDILIRNDGPTTANDVNYNLGLGNWIDDGIIFNSLTLTSTGAAVVLNPNFDGDTDPYLLAPNQTLASADEVTVHVAFDVAPTTSQDWNYFSVPNPSMTLGAADGFDETTPANKRVYSFVTWSDAMGSHVDRYDNATTAAEIAAASSDNQCMCDGGAMRFLHQSTLELEKTVLSDVETPGNPNHRDITFRLKAKASAANTVQVQDLDLEDDLTAICGGFIQLYSVQIAPGSPPVNTAPTLNAAYAGNAGENIFNSDGILDPGEEVWVDIKIEVAKSCTGTNTATFDGTNPEADDLTVATSSVVLAAPTADLVTVKTVNNATPAEGDTVVYNITVTNNGAADETNISLTDLLPAGVTYVSHTGGSYDHTTGVWTIGNLSSGSNVTLSITATVDGGTGGTTITNTTTVADGDLDDPTTAGDVLSVDINVQPNQPPVATDDNYTATEDTPLTLAPMTNDTDPDGDSITVTDINGTAITPGTAQSIPVSNGTVEVDAAGNITFTPDPDYNGGPITFPYTISDGNGGTDTANININVASVNDAPVATDNTNSGNEDTNVTGNVITDDDGDGVDSDVDGDTLTVTQFVVNGTTYNVPAGGSATANLAEGDLTVNSDGSYTFAPATDYNGTVPTATYTISDGNGGTDTADLDITIIPVNDPPVATNDTYTATEDTPLTLAPLTNDSDVDGDTLTVTDINGTSITPGTPATIAVPNGTVNVDAAGNITFVPDANYNGGPIIFPYTISDGNGGTDTASININVTPVNDAPVATDNVYNGTEDNNVTGNILTDDTGLGVDSDVDGDTLSVTQFVVNGTPYTVPAGGNSTANIPGVGTLTIGSDGAMTFVPEANYNGTVPTVTYTISDGNGGTDTADVIINIASVNDLPIASDDSTTTMLDTPVTFNATDNDGDIDGTIDTATVDLDPAPGIQNNFTDGSGNVWAVDPDGNVTFTPAPGFTGTATIPYTVNDNEGGTSNQANLSVFVQDPELTVTKDDGMDMTVPQSLTVGQVITYTITVTNSGNVALTNINVTDDNAVITAGNPIANLAPGNSVNVTATHTVTQADIDNGSIENTATAETFFNGTPVADDSDDTDPASPAGDDDPTMTNVLQTPELTVTKDDAIPANATVGDDIVYTIVVTNTGNVTLTDVVVTDANAQIGGNNTIASLAPGAFTTFTATHTITQADMNNGSISNTAIAAGNDPAGNPVTDTSDDANGLQPGDNDPTISDLTPYQVGELTATLDDNDSSDAGNPSAYFAGDNINYNLNVENTGNVSLTNPTVPAGYMPVLSGGNNVGDTNGDGILDPGETWVYTGSHTLTQSEIDAGMYSSQEDVSGTDPNGATVTDTSDDPQTNADNDPTTTYFNLVSQLELTKDDALPLFVQVGQDITYTLTVTNTGNTTLTNVTVTDANATITAGNPVASLLPGQSATVTATHTITQADMDAGAVANTASVTGDDPANNPVTDDASNDPGTPDPNDPTVSDLHPFQNPDMTVIKRETNYIDNGLAGNSAGDVIQYTITVQNTGNVTLSNISVSDDLITNAGGTVDYASGDTNTNGLLDVGETWTYTADYTVTQADVDTGSVRNIAVGHGLDTNGSPVSDVSDSDPLLGTPEDPTVTNFVQDPKLEVTKVDALPANVAVGSYITYTIVVTNTGNVTLSNVGVTDTNATMNGVGTTSTLAPGDSVTFTAVHQITQADMNAGSIDNQATATATDTNGNQVDDLSDDTDDPTDNDVNGDGEPDDVTNTDLTPFQQTGIAVSLDDNILSDANNPHNFNVGDVITYTAELTNTGNVSVTPDTPAGYTFISGDTNGDGLLDPDETWVYATTYQVTQADIDAGHIDNQVTFTGTAANGDAVSDLSDDPQDMTTTTDDVTVTYIGQHPELTVVKTGVFNDANGDGLANVDETIDYTIVVTNTGNVTLTDVNVTDPNAVNIVGSPIATLDPGQSVTVTAQHILDQTDIDAGQVENQATATGNDPANNPVTDMSDDPNTGTPDDSTIVTVPVHAEVTLEKVGDFIDANGNGYADVGEVITYTFILHNAGNQTISNVSIDDPFLTAAGVTFVSSTMNNDALLEVGEEWTFTGDHVLTQADIDAGNVDNQALVTAEDPMGNTITDLSDDPTNTANVDVEHDDEPDDVTSTNVPQHPELSLLKTGVFNDENENGLADVGETISYNFTVTNIGNVTLTDVMVDDPLPGVTVSGTPIILAPGQSDNTTFTAVYTITKEDIDNGFVSNSALVTGDDPQGNATEDLSDDPTNPADVDSEGDSEPDDPTVIETFGIVIDTIFTPNGDGVNDVWAVPGIQNFVNNNVKIYNRWGNLVYEMDHYTGNWDGHSNGRMTVSKSSKLLPVGTYFYVIDLGNGHEPFTGYLYLNR